MKHFSARDAAQIALGSALITICTWISIPMTVPFTLQTFAVCLISALLGAAPGICSVLIFLLLGAAGVPVFAGFRSGIPALLGTTGGYLIGFLFTALIVGFAAERFGRKILPLAISMVLGILVCYAFGTAWFMVVYARSTGPIGLMAALGWCVFPYLIPDALKVALAVTLTLRLYPLLQKMRVGV